ncbi:DUF1176 domain-containing protein [Prosthecomicrobium sp. N25]|uniref:DUF1176 domain-containing protein n=1 Tax=Prosthecomicrobium sp. N25 TaxID=3129254 RepID=UPI003077F485
MARSRTALSRLLPACLAACLLGAGEPRAQGADKQVEGWALRCEAETCRASRPSESGRQVLLLGRFPGQDALSVGFAAPGAIPDRERPVSLRLDGKAIGTLAPDRGYQPLERPEAFWILDTRLAGQIVQAGAADRLLRIEYLDVTGAAFDADFRLDGLAAVTAAMDQALGRKIRRDAAVAPKGLAPAPAVAKAELIARQGLPPRLVERHRAASDCEDPASPLLKPIPPVIGPLSKTAMLYAVPCAASGGEVSYRLWVVESGEIGGITPLYFALYDETFGWRGTDLLPNVAFDPREARLTARSTARSDAACGSRGQWRWKDYGFALEDFRSAPDCAKGANPADWPRVFPTR